MSSLSDTHDRYMRFAVSYAEQAEWCVRLDALGFGSLKAFRLDHVLDLVSATDVQFTYVGQAKNAEDARGDLADMMALCGELFDDLALDLNTGMKPRGVYKCDTPHGFRVSVVVDWLPEGCLVKAKRKRRYKPETEWQVSCQRD